MIETDRFIISVKNDTEIPEVVKKDAAAAIQPEWLTDKQVAAWLSCHKSTVWDLAKAGRIPKPRKLTNGMSRWSWDELQAWKVKELESVQSTYDVRNWE